jgi:hypothetical protein
VRPYSQGMRSSIFMMSFVASLLLLAPACSPVDPQPGQLGGPCRASLTPCDPGLECNGSGCAEPSGQGSANYGVTFAFKDNKTAVQADGSDNTIITARFSETNNGLSEPAPPNLQFRMWVDPPSAGTLEFSGTSNPEVMSEDSRVPWRITDASGSATVRFTGCDKALPDCIKFATVRVAIAPDVLVPVANVAIENIGAGPARPVTPEPEGQPGEPDVIATRPLPDGFGPTEACIGRSNEIYLKGDETAQVFRGEGTFGISEWRLRQPISVASIDSLKLEIISEELGTAVTFTVNLTTTGADLEIGEYDAVTSTSDPVEGSAQFGFLLAEGMLGTSCSRSSERRFAVQELRIEQSKIQKLTMSFVHGCDGGIIEGCFSIQPIP